LAIRLLVSPGSLSRRSSKFAYWRDRNFLCVFAICTMLHRILPWLVILPVSVFRAFLSLGAVLMLHIFLRSHEEFDGSDSAL